VAQALRPAVIERSVSTFDPIAFHAVTRRSTSASGTPSLTLPKNM